MKYFTGLWDILAIKKRFVMYLNTFHLKLQDLFFNLIKGVVFYEMN